MWVGKRSTDWHPLWTVVEGSVWLPVLAGNLRVTLVYMSSLQVFVNSLVRRYHMYQSIWLAPIREQLLAAREPGNS